MPIHCTLNTIGLNIRVISYAEAAAQRLLLFFQEHEVPPEKKFRVEDVNEIIGNSDKNSWGDYGRVLWAA
ncbi:hypothetical protein [Paenibacillus sp. ALJ109b]|uniref:hypothetical protein n=1 Tax=Paenibacillus sp. ALJ109b TaxID=2709068 RepID=UPI0013FBA192|nr:hypothetical protein [Paenibacillus sp. ALJ109b]NEU61728.1 hypothetical protein [Paenibacillus sp. ALJ109b]